MKTHEYVNIETNTCVTNTSEMEGAISFHECESCKEKFSMLKAKQNEASVMFPD